MKLYMSDFYRIDIPYPLDEVQTDILYFLYQPLVGSSAINTYMMLYVEGRRMNRFLKPCAFSRLTSFLSISLLDIEKDMKALEAIGLLRTYVKHQDNMTQYALIVQSPLSLKAFFKNQILSSLLQDSLTKEDFRKTMQYFQTSVEDLNQYEDVTASFTDVFTIQHHKQERLLKMNDDFLEKRSQEVTMHYDMDLLKRSLQDYQVSQALLKPEDFKYIAQLGSVYSVDGLMMASMIKDAMTSLGLDKKLLKIKIKQYCDIDQTSSLKEVYHKQPLQYQTQEANQNPLTLHMQYLDKITPYDLLKDKQGGKEPVYHDLMIVETLMVQLGLKPAVVNVLIEYVLGKNQNRLSKRYCEAIGSSWARKHIETAMGAYQELMREQTETKVETTNEVETVAHNQLSADEIESLLSELKEGQL